jgi:hypothetical protein
MDEDTGGAVDRARAGSAVSNRTNSLDSAHGPHGSPLATSDARDGFGSPTSGYGGGASSGSPLLLSPFAANRVLDLGLSSGHHHSHPHHPPVPAPPAGGAGAGAPPAAGAASHAGDDVLELFLDTPSVVGDEKRLKRLLVNMGLPLPPDRPHAGGGAAAGAGPVSAAPSGQQGGASSSATPTMAARAHDNLQLVCVDYHRTRSAFGGGSSGSTTPSAAAGSGGGGSGGGGGGAPGVAAGAAVGGRGGDALGPAAYGSLFQHHHHHHHHHHLHHHTQQQAQQAHRDGSGSPEVVAAAAAGGTGGGGGGGVPTPPLGWPASPEAGGAGGSSSGGSGGGGRGARTCLGCALADLRQVDLIFSKAVDFWGSMEFVVDVVVRRKEHSETLLRHSTSARMIAKATASLGDYMSFWQAFSLLCGRYADALGASRASGGASVGGGSVGSVGSGGGGGGGIDSGVDGMYAWLGASDAELDAEESAMMVALAHAPQMAAAGQPQLLLRDYSQ